MERKGEEEGRRKEERREEENGEREGRWRGVEEGEEQGDKNWSLINLLHAHILIPKKEKPWFHLNRNVTLSRPHYSFPSTQNF